MSALNIRLDDNLNNRLTDLAKKTGRTKTFYVREAIEEHLDDLEDYYMATQILADIRSGKEPVYSYSLEEVRKELGLDD